MLMRSRFDGLELISRVTIVLDHSRYSRLVYLTRDVFGSRLLLLRERRVREDRDNSRTNSLRQSISFKFSFSRGAIAMMHDELSLESRIEGQMERKRNERKKECRGNLWLSKKQQVKEET